MSLKSCSIGKERRSCRSRLSTRKFHLIIFLELFWEMYVLSLRIMKRVRTVKYDKKIYKLKANYYKWKLWSFYHKRYTLKIWVDFKENYFKSFFFFFCSVYRFRTISMENSRAKLCKTQMAEINLYWISYEKMYLNMNDYICACEHIPFMHNAFILPCQCTYLHEHTLRFGIMMLGLLLLQFLKKQTLLSHFLCNFCAYFT